MCHADNLFLVPRMPVLRLLALLSRAKFNLYRGRNVGIQTLKYQTLEFCPQIRPSGATRLHNFLRYFQHL